MTPEAELSRLQRELFDARKDAEWYRERCEMRVHERVTTAEELYRLRSENKRMREALLEPTTKMIRAALEAFSKTTGVTREIPMRAALVAAMLVALEETKREDK